MALVEHKAAVEGASVALISQTVALLDRELP